MAGRPLKKAKRGERYAGGRGKRRRSVDAEEACEDDRPGAVGAVTVNQAVDRRDGAEADTVAQHGEARNARCQSDRFRKVRLQLSVEAVERSHVSHFRGKSWGQSGYPQSSERRGHGFALRSLLRPARPIAQASAIVLIARTA